MGERLLDEDNSRLVSDPEVGKTTACSKVAECQSSSICKMLHHLMIGTWTAPGAIFTVQFDDEARTLKLVKRTKIPHDQPISWMTFDVSVLQIQDSKRVEPKAMRTACEKEHLRSFSEDILELCGEVFDRH